MVSMSCLLRLASLLKREPKRLLNPKGLVGCLWILSAASRRSVAVLALEGMRGMFGDEEEVNSKSGDLVAV